MALTLYVERTRLLLSDQGFTKFNDLDLITWVNLARSQAAAEGEAIRTQGTLNTIGNVQSYPFSSIVLPGAVGFQSVNSVRMATVSGRLLEARPWEWFFQYYIGSTPGTSVAWSQLGQGSSGTLYLGPAPSSAFGVSLDAVVLPIPLASDIDVEALPYPWTDAVPYFAAYMALLTVTNDERAQAMYAVYERFMVRARAMVTPSALPRQFPGAAGASLASSARPLVPPETPPQGQ